MESLLVVITVDERCDVEAKVFQVSILFRVNLFPFQGSEESFTVGIVARAARPTDAWDYVVLAQRPQVFGVCVLRTAI